MERKIINDILKECPLYGHCVHPITNKKIERPECKSGDLNQYMGCKNYDIDVILSVMETSKLKALGIEFSE